MKKKLDPIIIGNATDPEEIRRRQTINYLLYGVLGLSILALTAILIFLSINPEKWRQRDNQLLVLSTITAVVSTIGIYQINKRSSKLASLLLLLLLTLISTISDTPEQLTSGRSVFLFTLPVVVSSLILIPISSFFFATINSIIIIALANQTGTVPNIAAILGLFFLALISWLSSRNLEKALNDLRTINVNLDGLVTERTYALAESLSRERIEAGRNQAILSSIADGVAVFNAEDTALLVNPALSKLTEITMQDLTKISLDTFIHSQGLSPTSQKIILDVVHNPDEINKGVRVEWGKKTLSVNSARVLDTLTNENIGTVTVFRDVTYEAELEKMKTNFVAVVSHELRTPLNAIMGHTEILKESIYGLLNEKQTSITERIMVNVQRLLALLGDLLDEAQMKAGKLSIVKESLTTTSLLKNMHATMNGIATDKGLYLTDELDPAMPETLIGDPQRLQQIMVNLVNNSTKFTNEGGIHVRIARNDSDATHWVIEVTDTGIGIPEKDIQNIFETFRQLESSTTRKQGGFGLGLSIVKQLVELMNGQITIKSKLNKGSTFTITLPLIVEKEK